MTFRCQEELPVSDQFKNYSVQRECAYQAQIVTLFREKIGYEYLGCLQYPKGANHNCFGESNTPFRESELREFLVSRVSSNGIRVYTDSQIDEVLRQIRAAVSLTGKHPGALIDQNTSVYEMMISGVKAKPSQDENERDVMPFDFVNPHANIFSFAEEVSYNDQLTGHGARPDIVIYINGFAIAVIELKRSIVSIDEAIKQQLSNQCDLIPSFFTTVQFSVVANESDGFRYATIATPKKFWCAYKRDTNETGVKLSDKEAFTDFFEKTRIINFLRYGILTDGGIKKIMRPHQFHALNAAIPRLRTKKSGVIWHSQGSGKSLTMIWLASYIRANFEDPRVLIITDRTELDMQIKANFNRAGDTIHHATSQYDLLNTLKNGTEWLICSLIHKFGRHRGADGSEVVGDDNAPIPLDKYLEELKRMIAEKFGSDFKAKGKNIFVFVDECHRTQGGKLHDAMKAVMGQDVMLIGFTGTPLLSKDKKTDYNSVKDASEIKFGSYIHKYLHKQAVEDKVILDLQYEGRDVDQQITEKEKLDAKKEEITRGLDEARRNAIEDRWATLERVYSSKDRIERIGYSILDDMAKYPLNTSWCNAMLVAGNIECAYKYYDFFQNKCSDTRLKGRCAVVTSYEPSDYDLRKKTASVEIEASEKFKHDMAEQAFKNAGVRDASFYEQWAKDAFIKKPGQMKLLIVVDKLLTGFDAPCATFLYIDKDMKDHNLFQAICRVNRLGVNIKDGSGSIIPTHKEWGRIVDFKHLFAKITDAVTNFNDGNGGLGGFDKVDVEGLLSDYIAKGKEKLHISEEAYDSLKASWKDMSRDEVVDSYITDDQEIPAKERRQLLYKITGALVVAYSNMADYLGKAGYSSKDIDALHDKVTEARNLNLLIKQKSGDYFDPREKDPEMRALLDRFISASEADVIVPATADFSFLDLIDENSDSASIEEKSMTQGGCNAKAVAEIIEGKARSVINSWHGKDPQAYARFSERLQALLDEAKRETINYAEKMRRLIAFVKELKSGETRFPGEINTKLKRVLWNNKDSWCRYDDETDQIHLINRIAEIIYEDAPANWKDTSLPSSDMVKSYLNGTVNGITNEQLYTLFNLCVQNA